MIFLQVGMSREAPAMFKYKGLYLMLTSGCTGWSPNRAEVFFARCSLSLLLPCPAYLRAVVHVVPCAQ